MFASRSQQDHPQARTCSLGYVTEAAINHFLKMHPEIPEHEARSLVANNDTSKPLYFWQLYSVLGTDRIVRIVQNLYARIAADKEEPWLPNAFIPISDWDHHVATQAAFWLDAMGKGKFYHGGEGRLHCHHHYNANHVMTQQGAARWMHHMRLALDESDLGIDPRVRGAIDMFLHARMEKYAAQFGFQTGDRVYQAWHSEEWVRTESWKLRGPQPKETKVCPITGQVGACKSTEDLTTKQSHDIDLPHILDKEVQREQMSGAGAASSVKGMSAETPHTSDPSPSRGLATWALNLLLCRKF